MLPELVVVVFSSVLHYLSVCLHS